MLDSLDWLVVIFLIVGVTGLLSLGLMFLAKNETIKKISFYVLVVLGMTVSWMNAKMTPSSYPGELALGWGLGALSMAALLLEVCSKSEKKTKIARILTAISVVLGIANAFIF